ncbi:ComF family protein [Parablautia muri]|uniref:ComF family protein n=1 Tax=Parablautia muri TaxID=2320879 RepID=A0A9X5BC34_9FIRM|nr:ComF family protein [Parablautia muri]NBJ91204.1 ComF family protein [Parablautia muri]
MVVGNRILDLIFPKRCVVCDEITEQMGESVCGKCRKKIIYIKEPVCMKCGKQLKREEQEYCRDCEKRRHSYIRGTALYDYGSMADSIFRFKYAGRMEYASFYGRDLYEKKTKWLSMVRPDAFLPVPVHPSRKRKRGYNQAELIARELSEHSGIPVNTTLMERVRKTQPLKNQTHGERQNNLKRAFKIRRNDVKLNTIVIIDDIYTTGSTVDSMAQVLREVGITEIYFMALTIGRGI